MFFNVSIKSIVRLCFYLILIGVCVTSWIKFLKEPTTFEEKIVENQVKLPSFTLCPQKPDHPISDKPIESFEDVEEAIESVKFKYKIGYKEYKPYEETKRAEDEYNSKSIGVWYFAPRISAYSPYETVICLIWKPSKEHKNKPDWSFQVS